MTSNHEIKLIEKCGIAPAPAAAAELALPLTFYDLQWLLLPPIQHLHFYRFHHPSPTSHAVIYSLKSSLSHVLKNFLPLAGNLIWPVDSDRMPELRYKKGDSVSVTFAETSMDFDYLVGEHQRESYKFYDLLPQLPELVVTSGDEVLPVFALQVTVFPNSGISLGCTFRHVVCDGTAIFNFGESWASINKLNGDSLNPLVALSAPSYDRSVVQDPFDLSREIFNDIKLIKSQRSHTIPNQPVCKDKVQATFILHRSDIVKLKKFVSMKKTNSVSNNNVSAFVVTSALIWTCLSKSLDVVNEKVENDQLEYLCAYINCRQRFNPPIPQNYFGNCMVPCLVGSTHRQLAGNEGFLGAVSAIRDAIHKRVFDNEGILKGDWIPHSHTRILAVEPGMLDINGTTQHNVYNDNADFEWGKLEKQECVSMYSSATVMLISLSRRFEGALEFGISLPKNRMDAFTVIFANSINGLPEEPFVEIIS